MIAYNRISEFENVFTLVSVYAKVGYALYDLYTFEGYAIKQWYENMGEKDGTPLSQIIGDLFLYSSERRWIYKLIL